MPGTFLFAIIIAVIAVICAGGALASRGSRGKTDRDGSMTDGAAGHAAAKTAAWVLAGVTGLMLVISSYSPVGTRDIGVVTSFGRLAGHLGPGINWVAPWNYVTTIDDSYQVTDETFTVRIAGGQTAQATVQVRWNASLSSADDIFQNYKTTAGVASGLLVPELNAATNSVLDGYDPLTPLATGAAAGTPGNPSTSQLGAQIQAALAARTGTDVNVKTLVLKPLVYDKTVQGRINSILAQVAQTDVAQQSVKTAQAQAQANKIAEASLASNPLVLVQQCFNGLADSKFTLPAGSSCWPGSGSGVVIPSAGK